MKCPVCKAKIGFVESLTVLNPLSFKCQRCNSYLSLDKPSVKAYILLLCTIAAISFISFSLLAVNNILTKSFLKVLIPVIFLMVFLIHYFFWNCASARSKKDEKLSDITNLSC